MSEEPWTHGTADLGGLRLHYVTAGSGPLLLLLHGFPEYWYSWRRQIPALAPHFTVVAPDLRGYNESDKPHTVASYSLELLTADVQALIRHFGRDTASVAGHDWGGAVAWAFASDYPRSIERLAVLNCPHPGLFQKRLWRSLRQLRRSWYMFWFQVPGLPERQILRDPQLLARRVFRGAAVRKEAFTDQDLAAYAQAISKPGAARAALNYYRAAFRDLLARRLRPYSHIACDTLLLWGEQDPALGKELTYGMEPLFSGRFEVRYLPECGHWTQQEQPEAVNRHLLEFLAGVRL
jgi:pimeloyl-ACP methyl ester carboxylesterase